MKLKNLLLAAVIFFSAFSGFTQEIVTAQDVPNKTDIRARKLSKQEIDLVNSAQDYLAKVKSIEARFIQINPGDGPVTQGELYVSKPGKMLLRYNSPYKIDYYFIDGNLTQYDHDLEQVSRASIEGSPFEILLYDGINLFNNKLVTVTNAVDKGDEFLILTATKNKEFEDVTGLILKFSKLPIELKGIQRVDNLGNRIDINFSLAKVNKPIDKKLFTYEKPMPKYPEAR